MTEIERYSRMIDDFAWYGKGDIFEIAKLAKKLNRQYMADIAERKLALPEINKPKAHIYRQKWRISTRSFEKLISAHSEKHEECLNCKIRDTHKCAFSDFEKRYTQIKHHKRQKIAKMLQNRL